MGSIPISGTIWGISSAGRALPLQGRCQEFESPILHHGPLVYRLRRRPVTAKGRVQLPYGPPFAEVAQLVEFLPSKQVVAGSSPVFRSIFVWRVGEVA